MRLLVLSGMHPLPTNVARGTFVADHVRLLRDLGHDVRVVNPLPRMLRHHETRRSTLTGVAKAPQRFDFDGAEVLSPRYIGRPGQASPWWTARSVVRRHAQVQTWLGDWRPDAVVVHGLWPSGWHTRSACAASASSTAGTSTWALTTRRLGLAFAPCFRPLTASWWSANTCLTSLNGPEPSARRGSRATSPWRRTGRAP
jgi:hypothetical protein